jgi:hypothetical protein
MIKVRIVNLHLGNPSGFNASSVDLEYEKERGCSSEEEAEDECCSDSCAER